MIRRLAVTLGLMVCLLGIGTVTAQGFSPEISQTVVTFIGECAASVVIDAYGFTPNHSVALHLSFTTEPCGGFPGSSQPPVTLTVGPADFTGRLLTTVSLAGPGQFVLELVGPQGESVTTAIDTRIRNQGVSFLGVRECHGVVRPEITAGNIGRVTAYQDLYTLPTVGYPSAKVAAFVVPGQYFEAMGPPICREGWWLQIVPIDESRINDQIGYIRLNNFSQYLVETVNAVTSLPDPILSPTRAQWLSNRRFNVVVRNAPSVAQDDFGQSLYPEQFQLPLQTLCDVAFTTSNFVYAFVGNCSGQDPQRTGWVAVTLGSINFEHPYLPPVPGPVINSPPIWDPVTPDDNVSYYP